MAPHDVGAGEQRTEIATPDRDLAKPSVEGFLAARDLLLSLREDAAGARAAFRWPRSSEFNWALDYFDRVPPRERLALRIVDDDGTEHRRTFAELTAGSNRVANHLRSLEIRRGDRLLLMLGNVPELWETFLAAMKLGVVVIPASTLLGEADLADRVERGNVRAVVTSADLSRRFGEVAGAEVRVALGGDPSQGWTRYVDANDADEAFVADAMTDPEDPLLLYFTSGTTAQPKLVEHTHQSYPVGHLSTMYWIGLQPGDVHLNISSPGWAKHAWSNVFAPWNAESTAFVWNTARFDADALLRILAGSGVTTFCAPPTVWRMLIQADLGVYGTTLREAVSAGEPLNPEVIERVRDAWGITVRDGYGQTETTLQIGNFPGQPITLGSMGGPAPGYEIALLDADGHKADEGEICIRLTERPLGLMTGYHNDLDRTRFAMRDGYYHTGDIASLGEDGSITYVGRADDVFKASDYRISPFELESVLIEHEAVAEAAVVPSPDPLRLAVPKAFITLAADYQPDAETARSIFAFSRRRLAPFKRIRRIEFGVLPKTISGKIRRVELRGAELARGEGSEDLPRNAAEYWESDFPDLRGSDPSGGSADG